ncbi:MAG: protein kinase [Planctomycetes bacterium]|nr:protein kinase [Planctomycetota bacterium]
MRDDEFELGAPHGQGGTDQGRAGDGGTADADQHPSRVDERMATLLSGSSQSVNALKRVIAEESAGGDAAESDDLLARVNALEFLDNCVGELGSDLPERLGNYRIVGVLGRGGMGTVFEAFDDTLERVVALKVLAPGLSADPRMRKRFRTEARASATLHHQHIVPIYGFGEAGGLLFFAMERVDGISLDKHIAGARRERRPLMDAREAARRFAGVADALAHAHRRGILHRDVKPGNILVHPDGSLALADFGLSKISGDQSLSVSQHGGFLGTLHYAAPEQARARPVTEASDLYSLGVTLYETITGRLPLDGQTTEAMLNALLHGEHLPLRRVLPKAPRDLELVLDKLLSKEPEDRYTDGEVLARDLQRFADDEPVTVRRRSMFTRAWRLARKHRALSSAIAIAAALLLVLLVLSWQMVSREQAAKQTRHDNHIAQAITAAETELGALDGPSELIAALTGEPSGAGAGSEVLTWLERASRELPESPRVRAIRAAFETDPLPEATEALRQGRGHVALGMLDARIAVREDAGSFSGSDPVVWLELYRLYFARAIAKLTSSVGDTDSAVRDVLRASVRRPGAFAPAMLGVLLDWRPERGVPTLVQHLDRLLEKAQQGEARRSVARLLRVVAAPSRSPAAHLLDFELAPALRHELLTLANRYDEGAEPRRVGGDAAAAATTTEAGALEAALAQAAGRAARSFANEAERSDALTLLLGALDTEVAPRSPLQSWRVVHAFLADSPNAARRIDELGLPNAIVLRGLADALELDLPPDVFARLDEAVKQATALGVTGPRVLAIRARFADRTGDAATALLAAEDWTRAEPDDPEAWLARLRARLLAGNELDWAAFDGARVIQLALDGDVARRRVHAEFLAALGRAEARRNAPAAESLRALAKKFEGEGP